MSSKKVYLDSWQEDLIIEEWNNRKENPPTLQELTNLVYPGRNLDGRSSEGKAVKVFLASRNLKAPTKTNYERFNLTDEQKEYVANNCGITKPLEIARELFSNFSLTALSKEAKAVNDYIKTLPTQVSAESEYDASEDATADYKPPANVDRAANRVNAYVMNGVDKNKITSVQRKELTSLISYLHTYRFTHQINSYTGNRDRELFESSFIRYTYDKADLTQEEVDQYIVLCTEVVISSNIQRTIQSLQQQIQQEVDGGGRIPMPLVEAVNSARTEYNQCVGRQQKLLNDLKVKRSERISKQVKENASILNLVQMWKDEESRKEMIKMADMRREVLKTEMNKLSSMDDVKARIFGLTEEEVLDG